MSTTFTSLDENTSSWSVAGATLYGLITSATLLVIYYYWEQNKRFARLGNAIPGPPGVPFLGNALEIFLSTPEELLVKALEYSKHYGKVVKGWLGPYLVVFLIDPRDVEVILNSHVHIDKSDEYKFFKPWLGEGLLISTGEKWRTHRKMIAPTFHMNILKSFMDVFNRNSLAVVKKMRKEIDREFDVHDYMSGITVDILLETAMGVKRTHSDNAGFDYAVAVMKMCDILHQRHYKFWMRFEPLFKLTNFAKKQLEYLGIIHGLTNKVIKTKKEEFLQNRVLGNEPNYFEQLDSDAAKIDQKEAKLSSQNNQSSDPNKGTPLRDDLDEIDEQDVGEKKRLAFLDLMIETAHSTQNLTDEEIKEEVDTIMFEGHDTTAAGSSFVLCLLGIYKDVQDKVYQELYDIFGNSDRPVTYLDTLEMKYLERVIMETLRLYPPVPIIARKMNQEVKLASGDYTLPVGCTVVIGTYKIHHDPDYYKNPDTFDPDNFLPERTQNRHYYSYIPFSAGPRSCVGRKYAMLKLKVLLSTILRNYTIVSDLTEKDFRLTGDIILKRADGFRIRIQPRERVPV
uniref:Cytochrome P450 CYP4G280 n=1 Tax=Chrysoperla zastrowi sillemi TaxID=482137 RepID=A0A9E8BWA0_9NEOP|nr:cytochrome P450 CYP4G280 [Chrysoperla zastrowi sillemi]